MDLFCTDFLHGFLHEFLHGFFKRIFCTDFSHGIWRGFLHGFFARICCTDFCKDFLARIHCIKYCTDFCTDFLHGFLGVSQSTCWEAPKIHRENPLEILHALGAFWGGAWEAEGWGGDSGQPDQGESRTGGVGGAPVEEVDLLVDLNQDSKSQDPNHAKPSNAQRGRPDRAMNRDPELCSKFFKRKISPKIPSAPWAP